MKIVRVDNGAVAEIIPQYATPVEQWYGAAFAALCTEAPDEVEQNWLLRDGAFIPPDDAQAPADEARGSAPLSPDRGVILQACYKWPEPLETKKRIC